VINEHAARLAIPAPAVNGNPFGNPFGVLNGRHKSSKPWRIFPVDFSR
jgi:hypothetical protein